MPGFLLQPRGVRARESGFARALTFDQTFDVAAMNLAIAQLKSGRAVEAVKTPAQRVDVGPTNRPDEAEREGPT